MSEITQVRENVDLIQNGGRKIYLVGTAHVSRTSAELAEEVIREIKPDAVAVELCESRYQSLKDPDRWKNTDIVSVIREGKSYVLMAQLVLAAFQKKLGQHLQVKPGLEMLRALAISEELNAKTVLADRDVKTTLKRTWASLGFWSMTKVCGGMLSGLFSKEKIDEAEIERLKSADALEELMRDFSEALPDVRRALIDERDQYLAAKIREAPGDSVVAIVGAGHVPGIKRWIDQPIDLLALEQLPKPKLLWKIVGWLLPALVVGAIIYGFFSSGFNKSAEMIYWWCIITGAFSALGAAVSLAHPLTILASFIVAPFTTINPFIASGWVAGLVEAWIHKPRVSDLETIADDITTVRGLFRNRVSKILMIVASTNIFGTIGTFVGIDKILRLF